MIQVCARSMAPQAEWSWQEVAGKPCWPLAAPSRQKGWHARVFRRIIIRGHSVITWHYWGKWGPSKYERMQTGGRDNVSANFCLYIFFNIAPGP